VEDILSVVKLFIYINPVWQQVRCELLLHEINNKLK